MMGSFQCSVCGETKPKPDGIGTGFGRDPVSDAVVCYACCAVRDRARMFEEGRATLYLCDVVEGDGYGRPNRADVTNWPGSLRFKALVGFGRHNIAGRRYDAWFTGPDGFEWHGVTYGDQTQVCHCKRTKRRREWFTQV